MKKEIIPQESNRAEAYRMWLSSPMPMVTFVKTMDVSRLVRVSRKTGMKFTMLMCWCIGKAASGIEEFYTLLEGDKLFHYDQLAINAVVQNIKGGINTCDIPFSEDLQQFNRDYLEITSQCARECKSSSIENRIIVGTSAVTQTEIECLINQYSGIFNNPFLAWARYRKGLFKTTLPVSFQFHHVQMDGGQAAIFLKKLQETIKAL